MDKNKLKRIRNILLFYFGKNKIIIRRGGNVVERDFSSKIQNCRIRIIGSNNKLVISNGCSLNGVRMLLQGNNNEIILGRGVHINASPLQPTVINACNGTKISIGENSLLSNNIEIHSTDYHYIFDAMGKRINPDASVSIGKHVWIGLGVKILKGSSIADNTIVGAGSIVSGKIDEPCSMVVGVPAKIIKKGVTWAE